MLKFLFGTLGAVVMILFIGSVITSATRYDYDDAAAYARQEAEAARIYRDLAVAEAVSPVDVGLAVFWRLFPAIVAIVAVASAARWGWAALDRFRAERWPREDGLLPVRAETLDDQAPAALAAWHLARVEDARRPHVPASLVYHAPHYRADAGRALMDAHPEPATGELPSFAQLLDVGRIGRGQPLCLGIDTATGDGVWGDWRDLYSAGLGGKQGSGKTWTAASLISQSLLGGARVILCDPHAGDDESLRARLAPLTPYCELVAEDEGPILEAARYAHDEFQRRKAAAKAGKAHDRAPVILVIDEWTSLLRGKLGAELPPILAALSTEGRKYGVNALLLAQRWEAEAAGGSDVRNTLTAHYVHRCRGDEGRMQTGMRAGSWPGDPLTLAPGESYLFDTRGGVRKVATPTMTAGDLNRVAAILGGAPAAGPDAPRPLGFHARAGAGDAAQARPGAGPDTGPARASALGRGETPPAALDPEAARIVARFAAGATVHELAAELAGTSNPGDRRYKAARERVEALLRNLVEGRA